MQYKSIGIRESDYRTLSEKKKSVENIIGKRLNWANFLLLLADLRPIDAIISDVAVLHDSGGEDEEVNPEEYEEVLPWVTRQDVEEVIKAEADRIILQLKDYLDKK
ncbi:hypothetical protein ACFLW0_00600 [Chloroflexota bacterium]